MKNIYVIENRIICKTLTEVGDIALIPYDTLTSTFSRNDADSGTFTNVFTQGIFIEKMSIKRVCDLVSKISVIDYNCERDYFEKKLLSKLDFLLTATKQ